MSSLSTIRNEILSTSVVATGNITDVIVHLGVVMPELLLHVPYLGKATKGAIDLLNAKHYYENLKAGILLEEISKHVCDDYSKFRENYLEMVAPLSGSKDAVLKALEAVQEIDDDVILSALALLAAEYKKNDQPCDMFFLGLTQTLKSFNIDEYYMFANILSFIKKEKVDLKMIALLDVGSENSISIGFYPKDVQHYYRNLDYQPIVKNRKLQDIRRNLVLALQQPGVRSNVNLMDGDTSYVTINKFTVDKLIPFFSNPN